MAKTYGVGGGIDGREMQRTFHPLHRHPGGAEATDYSAAKYHGYIQNKMPELFAFAEGLYVDEKGQLWGSDGKQCKVISPTIPVRDDRIDFLYNPTSIRFDYSIDQGQLHPEAQDVSQISAPKIENSASFGFQLLFDRTFEVMEGSVIGVLNDVFAMERLMDMTADLPVPHRNLVKVAFARPASFQFYGEIQRWSVEYTHFSANMIPMRCGVDISLTRLTPRIIENAARNWQSQYDAAVKDIVAPEAPKYGAGEANRTGESISNAIGPAA